MKKYLPFVALLAACGGLYTEEDQLITSDAAVDEDAGEVGLVTEELLACDTKKMHDASRAFFMSRVPSGTVCAGKTTDQRWACTGQGGRTWSVYAYDQTNIQVYRDVQPSQGKKWTYACDYSSSCKLSCRIVITL